MKQLKKYQSPCTKVIELGGNDIAEHEYILIVGSGDPTVKGNIWDLDDTDAEDFIKLDLGEGDFL